MPNMLKEKKDAKLWKCQTKEKFLQDDWSLKNKTPEVWGQRVFKIKTLGWKNSGYLVLGITKKEFFYGRFFFTFFCWAAAALRAYFDASSSALSSPNKSSKSSSFFYSFFSTFFSACLTSGYFAFGSKGLKGLSANLRIPNLATN